MYRTCLFCHSRFAENQAIEHFPIGRTLSFDAAKGRLWVVCRRCGQWNLTPLEERWEAIEECERAFVATRRRVSTEEIGLARIRDGTELIRVGRPLRPEFAAWRYERRFAARQRRAWAAGAITGTAFLGLAVATHGLVGLVGPVYALTHQAILRKTEVAQAQRFLNDVLSTRVGRPVRATPATVELHLRADAAPQGWLLRAKMVGWLQPVDFAGDDALRTAHLVLPSVNVRGGWKSDVQRAVREIEQVSDPHRYFARAVEAGRRAGLAYSPLQSYPVPVRLALEMVAHEESERRAMEGELAVLAAAWKDAEEIAAIADDLVVPTPVRSRLQHLRHLARAGTQRADDPPPGRVGPDRI